MKLTELHLENIVTFQNLDLTFSPGINVLIGENGIGKTHILKILYAASRAACKETSFPYKLVRVFQPTDMHIGRLVRRPNEHIFQGRIEVKSDFATLSCEINEDYKDYEEIRVYGTESWCSQTDCTSLFIPEKDVLLYARQLNTVLSRNYFEADDTQLDMLLAINTELGEGEENPEYQFPRTISRLAPQCILPHKKQRYYLKAAKKYELTMASPAMKKIAILKTLGANGSLSKANILFWDAPDADMDASSIPGIVDVMLDLHWKGTQIFVATNNCLFARYMEAVMGRDSIMQFYSIYWSNQDKKMISDSGQYLSRLPACPLEKKFARLLRVICERATGGTYIVEEVEEDYFDAEAAKEGYEDSDEQQNK